MTEFETPLAIVRSELWRGSDRNPSDENEVMRMIREAVVTFGDKESDFTERLIRSLDSDPESSRSLGAGNAALIESLGILVKDKQTAPVARWGALSLLGALAVTHDPGLPEETLLGDPILRRSHLPGYIARYVLYGLQLSETKYSTIAEAFLSHTRVSPEIAAIEFDVLGLHRESSVEPEPGEEIQGQEKAPPVFGSSISEPHHLSIVPDDATKEKIRNMDWLKNPDLLEGDARDIFHDGKKIATIIDLTTKHPVLASLHKDLKKHPQGSQLWPRLAVAITQHTNNHSSRSLKLAKVTTFYTRSRLASSGSTLRAFYVTLGTDPEGCQLLGLIAATLTKPGQSRAFGIMCTSNKRKISSR